MRRVSTKRSTKSNRLLSKLDQYERFVVVTHDNPDPDAIASGWAMHVLISEKLHKPVRLVGGGAIVRAENKRMVDLLRPPIELVNTIRVPDSAAAILVDCAAGTSNQLLTRRSITPVAVIDHHEVRDGRVQLAFSDIRPRIAASATITASYLREQRVEPQVKLATALLYAINTETSGCAIRHTTLDRSIIRWLSEWVDPELLADIENAPLSRAYFGDLAHAMRDTFLFGDVALCFLPRAEGAEIVGEVADLLIRGEGIQCVLCSALVDDDLLLSVRTKTGAANATSLIQTTIEGLGSAGGHAHRAGGKIPKVGHDGQIPESLERELRSRWLNACGAADRRGSHLVNGH